MIFADSGVWIDFFNGVRTPETDRLAQLLARSRIVVGDLVLTEVLQGFTSDRDFQQAREALTSLPLISVTDPATALLAADHYPALRRRGITVRKTIDCLIATRCIAVGLPLLYSDRDFDPFVAHLGLRSALTVD
ncbi:MAG: PIN domain nuclease [Allosphingosinicella sp.]|uniref:type II toxin-antitoxin system VapC family toxin n=1 Tax=Allosphingosinicella sp. TaxID=2823234 RepID=UPI00395EF99F